MTMKFKSLKALKDIRDKFVDQETEKKREEAARLRRLEKKLRTDREEYLTRQTAKAENEAAEAEKKAELTKASSKAIQDLSDKKYLDHEEIHKRDLAVEDLLSLALHHVTKLQSYDTAKRILTRANTLLPSEVNVRRFASESRKNPIRLAHIALSNLMKVSKKKRYKTGGKYDGTHAKQHWMQAFNEAIQEAFLEIRIDINKREGTFFTSINTTTTELPVSINESKKFIKKSTQVVVNVTGSLRSMYPEAKATLIEGKLMLIQGNLIGLRTTPGMKATKGQLAAANEIAAKVFEATVYPIPLSRPSKNIMWFLVLDFGVGIDTAMFPEHMSTTGLAEVQSPIVASNLGEFIRRFDAARQQQVRLTMEINRKRRIEFEKNNEEIYKLIKTNEIVLDALVEKKKELEAEFASLTSFEGDDKTGLSIRSYNTKFDDFFAQFMRQQIMSAEDIRNTRHAVIDQRLDARYVYWLHNDVTREASKIRARVKAMSDQLKLAKLDLIKQAA